jgi:exodeoxyribonuclease VII large subunit
VVPDAEEWLVTVGRAGARLQRGIRRRIDTHAERLRWLTGRAALVSPSARLAQQAQRLDELERCLFRALHRQLQQRRERLRWLGQRAALVSPASRLKQQSMRLQNLEQRMQRASRDALRRARDRLLPLLRTLNAVSPLATLERGYAIVSIEDGGILRDAASAQPGMMIEARLGRGTVRARVEGNS